jgi:hypothetical protein
MTRILFILVLLCPCVAAQTAVSQAIITPEAAYDFGTIRQGSKVSHGFTVKNSTAAPLTIQSIELSMPGMHARFVPLLAPSSEGKITVEWDTSHVTGEMDGVATVLFVDRSQPPAILQLKGVVRPPIEILPFPAVFMSAFRGEDNECRLRIVNNEDGPTAISLLPAADTHFTASLTVIEPGRVYELVAKIPSSVFPGRYDEELSLSTDNAVVGRINIPVHVFVKPDLYANPEAVDFGSISAEELRKKRMTAELLTQTFLVKRRQGEFEIKKVTAGVAGIEVSKDPPHGRSSSYRINVALDPHIVQVGKLDGFVEIETNDRDFPRIKVPVTGKVF